MKSDFTVFIMGADTPTGLATGRSLFKLPVKVIGLYENSESVTLKSKCWHQIINVSGSISEQFSRAIDIQKKIDNCQKAIILFTSDEQVIGYWENGEELDKYFIVPVTKYKHGNFLMDKSNFHKWATDSRVLVPPSWVLSNLKDLDVAKKFVEFPSVLKPMVRKKEWNKVFPRKKLFKFESYTEFDNFTADRDIFDYSPSYVLQRWIEGGDEDVYFVLYVHDLAGNLLGRIGGQKHLQWPTSEGSTAICEICNDTDLLEAGDKVLQMLKVVGLNSIEFKKDRYDGQFYVTEPTVGRNDYQSGLSMLCEPNLTRLLVGSVFGLNDEQYRSGGTTAKGVWIDDNVLLQHLINVNFTVLRNLLKLICKNNLNVMFLLFSMKDLGPIKQFLRLKLKKRNFFMKIIRRAIDFHLDSFFLFSTDLSINSSVERLKDIDYDDIRVREYEGNDFSAFVKFLKRNGYFGKNEFQIAEHLNKWLSQDYSCVIALDNDDIIGMGWFCTCNYKKWPAFARFPDLPERPGLLFSDFVQKEHRGKGIHKRIMKSRNKSMIERGVENSVCFVGVKNFASLNNYMKICDRYRLVYNITIDLPKETKISFFLNKKREGWIFNYNEKY